MGEPDIQEVSAEAVRRERPRQMESPKARAMMSGTLCRLVFGMFPLVPGFALISAV